MKRLSREVINAIRIGGSDTGRIVGKSLKALRELAGLTQDQMATRLGIGQAAISKIEHRGDVQISSIQRYIRALGAELRIDAVFSHDAGIVLRSRDAFEDDIHDENQLVFPIFHDDSLRPRRDFVLSIRPQYSEKIMQGKKTVELRRRFPISATQGTIAHIYSTSPIRAMVGRVKIAAVIKLPLEKIWDDYSNYASIGRPEFDSYFSGLNEGFALKFEDAKLLPRPIDLSELRSRFGFEPPQSFLYASPLLRRALQDEYSNVSH